MGEIMKQEIKSIRTFIGAKDYKTSKSFYLDLGFEEKIIFEKMSFFKIDNFGFYLQDFYVKDWIDNSMVLLEVENLDKFWDFVQRLGLDKKYTGVKLIPIKEEDWGREFLITDPSGVLWHFAEYS